MENKRFLVLSLVRAGVFSITVGLLIKFNFDTPQKPEHVRETFDVYMKYALFIHLFYLCMALASIKLMFRIYTAIFHAYFNFTIFATVMNLFTDSILISLVADDALESSDVQ